MLGLLPLLRRAAAAGLSDEEWSDLEGALMRSNGHCMTMGTASTMACVTEALGMDRPEERPRRRSTLGATRSPRPQGG